MGNERINDCRSKADSQALRLFVLALITTAAQRADACSPPPEPLWNMTVESVLMDGQPVADLSPWQGWSLEVIAGFHGDWTIHGSRGFHCNRNADAGSGDAAAFSCVGGNFGEQYNATTAP